MAEASETATIGWKVDPQQRTELLQQFPPRYDEPVADHVTLRSRVPRADPLPPEVHAEIIGKVDDGAGVEAMVVRIDGTTDRPDGSTYHITWSLAEGREGIESNDALRSTQWMMFDLPMPVKLTPARWP